MRSCQKSSFRDVLLGNPSLSGMFLSDSIFNDTEPLSLYLDFLYFIHMPPPATLLTYSDLALHLWKLTVSTHVYEFGDCLCEI